MSPSARPPEAGLVPPPYPAADEGLHQPPPLLEVQGLVKHYRLPREHLLRAAPRVDALSGVSFTLHAGRSLGLVGESGSGKSTLARLVMALEPPSAGSVRLLGRDLNRLAPAALRAARRDFQMVFQDPYGSLDPRQKVARVIAEPLVEVGVAEARRRIGEALDAVGLRASDGYKYPHEFSGGQRQRIAIARALITRPRLIVADEPVSALDVSVQAQVLNLLQDLQQQFGVTYLLISHDLAVVDHVCDEVAVLYAGCIVEQGPAEVLFRAAAHPYTRALLAALPQVPASGVGSGGVTMAERGVDGAASPGAAHRDVTVAERAVDSVPAPRAAGAGAGAGTGVSAFASSRVATEGATAAGCSFAARCGHARALCLQQAPQLQAVAAGHLAACHFARQVMLSTATEEGSK